ncbi:oligomeric complex COG6 [Coniophora puteana RWD-64-598 SS2]|uniref:Conserved oligomeric Golgi complex subunit 6 n=1 Tax=Coniophora puteana (strain RWD-64-598) TaxID=741705 RepID=A0A5M3MZR8_CONPW|nr:oligomeric complex COG6 [Coniophora puteana RWD-64-598 SS2]EIW84653.1 oligomeric complex COG6 [Coniophora puteana RWD-64-598 SS2]
MIEHVVSLDPFPGVESWLMSSQVESPISPSATPSVQLRNPISLRIRKILSTNYTDEATKEAIYTVSSLYSDAASHVAISRPKQDGDDVDEDEVPPSARTRVEEYVLNDTAAKARKNLRRDLEDKLAKGSQHFLLAFGEVDQKLADLENHVAAMRASCDDAEAQLQLTTTASKALLERAEKLRSERQEIDTQARIVDLFLSRFLLSEQDAETLASAPVGPRFFAAMDRAEKLRADCAILFEEGGGEGKAGMDILARTSSQLETAFDRLHRWAMAEFRAYHLEASPAVREAIRRLSSRGELLVTPLQTLTATHSTHLSSAFTQALKSFALHAHDALRYVGDMLAWIHQAVAGECEFLESIFATEGADDEASNEKKRARMVGSVRTFGNREEDEWTRGLLDGAVEGLCAPLRARIQQTLRSQESAIVSYKLANLVQYYALTMRRTIGREAFLSVTLDETTELSYKVFFDTIDAQGRALSRIQPDPHDNDLSPPLWVLEHAQLLREIMQVYDSSLLSGEDPEVLDVSHARETADAVASDAAAKGSGEGEAASTPSENPKPITKSAIDHMLNATVDPALEACFAIADEKQRISPRWDSAVFKLNCAYYLQSVLEPYDFTKLKQARVQKTIDECVASLTEDHYKNLLRDAGLNAIVDALDTKAPSDPLSHLPTAQPSSLTPALAHFALWLTSPAVVHSPRLTALTSATLSNRIHHGAIVRLARAYDRLCRAVRDPAARYEAPGTMLGAERPFGNVGILCQVLGVEEGEVVG